MLSLLIFIIVLGIIVFVHEFGHFIAAKRSGVRVDEFGFGFPPRIFGVKRGDTIYSLNWIPLGGFVKIKGETGEDRTLPDSFSSKPAWNRAIILLAGVGMNILLAAVLLGIGFGIGVPQITDNLPPSAIIKERSVQIVDVLSEKPAARAGVHAGDTILSVDGREVADADMLRDAVRSGEGDIKLVIRRNHKEQELTVTPLVLTETGARGIGVQLANVGIVRYPWYIAIPRGFAAAFEYLWIIIVSFGLLLKNLVIGKGLTADLSGPVGIAVLTGQVARLGFTYLLQFIALLSLNLAVINAVPFPALDGGRFLFLVIEKLRGKPMPKRAENIAHQIGFALLMLLVLAVTYRDLVRYGGAITGFFKRLF